MSVIVNTYSRRFPAVRFIGERIENIDSYDGILWPCISEGIRTGVFRKMSLQKGVMLLSDNTCGFFSGETPIGLTLIRQGRPEKYYRGIFVSPRSEPSDAYETFDIPSCEVGISRVLGKDWDVCNRWRECGAEFLSAGLHLKTFEDGYRLVFEAYTSGNVDEDGNITVEVGHFLEEKFICRE